MFTVCHGVDKGVQNGTQTALGAWSAPAYWRCRTTTLCHPICHLTLPSTNDRIFWYPDDIHRWRARFHPSTARGNSYGMPETGTDAGVRIRRRLTAWPVQGMRWTALTQQQRQDTGLHVLLRFRATPEPHECCECTCVLGFASLRQAGFGGPVREEQGKEFSSCRSETPVQARKMPGSIRVPTSPPDCVWWFTRLSERRPLQPRPLLGVFLDPSEIGRIWALPERIRAQALRHSLPGSRFPGAIPGPPMGSRRLDRGKAAVSCGAGSRRETLSTSARLFLRRPIWLVGIG